MANWTAARGSRFFMGNLTGGDASEFWLKSLASKYAEHPRVGRRIPHRAAFLRSFRGHGESPGQRRDEDIAALPSPALLNLPLLATGSVRRSFDFQLVKLEHCGMPPYKRWFVLSGILTLCAGTG